MMIKLNTLNVHAAISGESRTLFAQGPVRYLLSNQQFLLYVSFFHMYQGYQSALFHENNANGGVRK